MLAAHSAVVTSLTLRHQRKQFRGALSSFSLVRCTIDRTDQFQGSKLFRGRLLFETKGFEQSSVAAPVLEPVGLRQNEALFSESGFNAFAKSFQHLILDHIVGPACVRLHTCTLAAPPFANSGNRFNLPCVASTGTRAANPYPYGRRGTQPPSIPNSACSPTCTLPGSRSRGTANRHLEWPPKRSSAVTMWPLWCRTPRWPPRRCACCRR